MFLLLLGQQPEDKLGNLTFPRFKLVEGSSWFLLVFQWCSSYSEACIPLKTPQTTHCRIIIHLAKHVKHLSVRFAQTWKIHIIGISPAAQLPMYTGQCLLAHWHMKVVLVTPWAGQYSQYLILIKFFLSLALTMSSPGFYKSSRQGRQHSVLTDFDCVPANVVQVLTEFSGSRLGNDGLTLCSSISINDFNITNM